MEKPNLNYIKELSMGDKAFEKKILGVIKEEFATEMETYFNCKKSKNYKETAEIVHKIKHKISTLGLENGFHSAIAYEKNLLENSMDGAVEFEKALESIEEFVKLI